MGCEAPQGVNSCFLAHRVPQLSEFVKGHLLYFSPGDSQCTEDSEKLCGKETALTLFNSAFHRSLLQNSSSFLFNHGIFIIILNKAFWEILE